MKKTSLPMRVICSLLLLLACLGPVQFVQAAAPSRGGAARASTLQANKLIDYIRGNRSRMVQVATIGLGLGLVILMTATRKN